MEILLVISNLVLKLFEGTMLFLGFIFLISFLAFIIDKFKSVNSDKK